MKTKVYGHNQNACSSVINEVVHNIEELVVDLDYVQLGVIDGNHCVITENIRMVIDRKEYDRLFRLLKVDISDEEEASIEGKDTTENNIENNIEGLEV